jgi:hypothetical protein
MNVANAEYGPMPEHFLCGACGAILRKPSPAGLTPGAWLAANHWLYNYNLTWLLCSKHPRPEQKYTITPQELLRIQKLWQEAAGKYILEDENAEQQGELMMSEAELQAENIRGR